MNYKNTALVLFVALCVGIVLALVVSRQAPENEPGTVLITGSNRGIGYEFAAQYAQKGWTVIATHRRDVTPQSLEDLMAQYDSVTAEKIDLLDHASIDALAAKLQDTSIDLLINNAAILSTGDPASAQTFGTLKHELFDIYMRTNALGPMKVTEAFFPHVAASDQKKIVNISSMGGSLSSPQPHSRNTWYRASKTALNGLMVSMVPTARASGITVVMFEPGWTWTGKDESRRDPEQLEPAEVVAAMIATIDGLALSDTGRFMLRDGKTQPW